MTIRYMDYVNGDNANGGTSWADAKRTIQGFTAGILEPGDIIRLAKSPAPSSIGNGTWTNLSKTVTLASAQNVTIENCDSLWTDVAGNDLTIATNTTRKQGSYSMRFYCDASPQASILQSYKEISELDLSSYQKISFWLRNTGAIVSGNWIICLCSDTAGATIVDSFPIPAKTVTNYWIPLTLVRTGGGNLGSSIKSVALYSGATTTGMGSKYLYLDNIIACTTSGLSLQSLISKNSAEKDGTDTWHGIQSIVGTTVLLDNHTSITPTSGQGYSGTTETVTTYKRETIKTDLGASSWAKIQEVQDSGTSGNNIEFQGGWNTGTTVQEGETFFDGLEGAGYGLYIAGKNYITLNYLNFCRYNDGINIEDTTDGIVLTTINSLNNNSSSGIEFAYGCKNITVTMLRNLNNNYRGSYAYELTDCIFTTVGNICNNHDSGIYYSEFCKSKITTINNVNNNGSAGLYLSCWGKSIITTISNVNNNSGSGVLLDSCSECIITTITNANNNQYGIAFYSAIDNLFTTISNANNNSYYGVTFNFGSCNNIIRSISTTGNSNGGIKNYGKNYLYNASIAEGTEVVTSSILANARIYSQKHDAGTYTKIFTDGGLISSLATDRSGGTGIMWKLAITSADRDSDYPLDLKIAKIAVLANKLVTVKVYMKKDHATNIVGKLVCKGGQISGVPDDVVDTKADDLNWEELTITFTPTEVGVIEIEAWAYYSAANGNVYVEDMTIAQAD